jgi:hypothetical protein
MSVDHCRAEFFVAKPGLPFLLAGCSAIFSASPAHLSAADIAACCLSLPEEKTFMVPAPVVQNE